MMLAPSSLAFREAMSRLGAAVNVVTSSGDDGHLGFTATAVCSVSDQPPTLIVCMFGGTAKSEALRRNGVLCVNTLAHRQHDLGRVFAGSTRETQEDRFRRASWRSLVTGAPVLDGALASFDCTIDRAIEVGTHSILICSVVGVSTELTGEPLLYFDRQYCSTRQLHEGRQAVMPTQ